MEDEIIASIKRYVPNLVDMATEERPAADRGSVEVTAAVMMLISTISFLHNLPNTPQRNALIDSLVDNLPRAMDERAVSLADAIAEPDVLKLVSDMIMGAYHTNLHTALTAIYNVRAQADFSNIIEHSKGPLGEIGGMSLITGWALVGEDNTPDMLGLADIYAKHFSNVTQSTGGGSDLGGHSKSSTSSLPATTYSDRPEDPRFKQYMGKVIDELVSSMRKAWRRNDITALDVDVVFDTGLLTDCITAAYRSKLSSKVCVCVFLLHAAQESSVRHNKKSWLGRAVGITGEKAFTAQVLEIMKLYEPLFEKYMKSGRNEDFLDELGAIRPLSSLT